MSIRPNILAIADDLTGAAEIAAIGAEFGLSARVVRTSGSPESGPVSVMGEGLLVLDTDSRALDPQAAALCMAAAMQNLELPCFRLIFKKTDSLLRGNIPAELAALAPLTHHPRTLLLAQNPSKGRIIRNGRYLIDDVPLDETSFRQDPEHPRRSANLADLLAPATILIVNPRESLPPAGLLVANAGALADVAAFADGLPLDTLPAGGADFFRAILRHHLHAEPGKLANLEDRTTPRLLIAGSASAYSRQTVRTWQEQHLPVFPLPEAVLDSPDAPTLAHWLRDVPESLRRNRLAILAITHPLDESHSREFRAALAAAIHYLLALPALSRSPLRLYIEGGATASAAVDLLGWREFAVAAAGAPGVVSLRPLAAEHILLTIKPGSYPWPAGPIDSW